MKSCIIFSDSPKFCLMSDDYYSWWILLNWLAGFSTVEELRMKERACIRENEWSSSLTGSISVAKWDPGKPGSPPKGSLAQADLMNYPSTGAAVMRGREDTNATTKLLNSPGAPVSSWGLGGVSLARGREKLLPTNTDKINGQCWPLPPRSAAIWQGHHSAILVPIINTYWAEWNKISKAKALSMVMLPWLCEFRCKAKLAFFQTDDVLMSWEKCGRTAVPASDLCLEREHCVQTLDNDNAYLWASPAESCISSWFTGWGKPLPDHLATLDSPVHSFVHILTVLSFLHCITFHFWRPWNSIESKYTVQS